MRVDELLGIYEMATLHPREHGFGLDVKLNILQPGDKKLPHEPRVKVLKKGHDADFSIMLSEDPDKMQLIDEYEGIISTKEYNKLFADVQKYRMPFLAFWRDSNMSVLELRELMAAVDTEQGDAKKED
jgi:hypothetical protein